MSGNWQETTALTSGQPIVAHRIRIINSGTAVEDRLKLSPKARLLADDLFFPATFDRSHGSIDMTNIVLK